MQMYEIEAKLKALESRLEVKEKALNEALKQIEELKSNSSEPVRILKNEVEPDVYETLFNYACNAKTGELCEADEDKKADNFKNLYRNILKTVGYRSISKSKTKATYYFTPKSIKDLNETEYKRFGKLIRKITAMLAEYKIESEVEENE